MAHLLALVAVGLWSDALGGRAPLILPTTFIGGLGLGCLAGLNGAFLVNAGVMLWASLAALVTALLFEVCLPLSEPGGMVLDTAKHGLSSLAVGALGDDENVDWTLMTLWWSMSTAAAV